MWSKARELLMVSTPYVFIEASAHFVGHRVFTGSLRRRASDAGFTRPIGRVYIVGPAAHRADHNHCAAGDIHTGSLA